MKVAIAGGFYSVVLWVVWGAVAMCLVAVSVLQTRNLEAGMMLVAMPMMAAVVLALNFGLGMAWAGVVAVVVVPLSAWVIRLMAWPTHRDTAAKLIGGLVAYIATLPLSLRAAHEFSSFDVLSGLFVIAHCGLAIAMGQAAGCLSAVPDLHRRRRGRLAASSLRFGVWQLLAITIPVAVVLSVLQAIDMLNAPMALASIAAAFCAVATWQPVTWLVNRYLDRRLGKRRKRRLANCSTWNNSPT